MTDNLEAMVARIDERTEHMEGDIKEVKESCHKLGETVNEHTARLATIEAGMNNNHGLSKRKTIGFGGLGGFITGAIIAAIEYFRTH